MNASELDCPEFFQNPYPFYRRIRAEGGVLWLEHKQPTTQRGVWLFARHADALMIFKETSAISKSIAQVRPPGVASKFDLHMLHRDAPDHLRLRRLVAEFFSGSAMTLVRSRVAALAGELIDVMPSGTAVDLIADFAEVLPLRVIASLIGVPRSDLKQIRAWSRLLGDGFDSLLATPELLAKQRDALAEFLDYLQALLEARQTAPGDDLLSHLLAAEGREGISRDEVIAMVGFLLFAGHETTINLLGNGLWLLLSHRDRWAYLGRHPEAMGSAIEEILRFESPEQRTSFRLTLQPLEIGEHRIEAGEQIGMILGSANRDEAEFPEPDRFDLARTPNRHLAFGFGLHQCMGKHLARLEAHVALTLLLERCPDLQLATDTPEWRRNSFFRGLATLPAVR